MKKRSHFFWNSRKTPNNSFFFKSAIHKKQKFKLKVVRNQNIFIISYKTISTRFKGQFQSSNHQLFIMVCQPQDLSLF